VNDALPLEAGVESLVMVIGVVMLILVVTTTSVATAVENVLEEVHVRTPPSLVPGKASAGTRPMLLNDWQRTGITTVEGDRAETPTRRPGARR